MPHDDEQELSSFLNKAHRALDPEPPSFDTTLEAARRRQNLRDETSPTRWRIAVAAATVVLTLAGGGLFLGRLPSSDLDAKEAMRLAESLSVWQGPTDFLHRSPGADLLENLPRVNRTLSLMDASAAALAAATTEETP